MRQYVRLSGLGTLSETKVSSWWINGISRPPMRNGFTGGQADISRQNALRFVALLSSRSCFSLSDRRFHERSSTLELSPRSSLVSPLRPTVTHKVLDCRQTGGSTYMQIRRTRARSSCLSQFFFHSPRYPQSGPALRDGHRVVLVRASLCPALISIVGYRGIVRFTGCIRVNVLLSEAFYPIPLGAFGWIHSRSAVLRANFFPDASRPTVSLIVRAVYTTLYVHVRHQWRWMRTRQVWTESGCLDVLLCRVGTNKRFASLSPLAHEIFRDINRFEGGR